MAESEHVEGDDSAAPTEQESDGIGLTHIVVDVADKSVSPAQV